MKLQRRGRRKSGPEQGVVSCSLFENFKVVTHDTDVVVESASPSPGRLGKS